MLFVVNFIGPADCQLTASQVFLIKDAIQRSKEKLQRFCIDHRDLHVIVISYLSIFILFSFIDKKIQLLFF